MDLFWGILWPETHSKGRLIIILYKVNYSLISLPDGMEQQNDFSNIMDGCVINPIFSRIYGGYQPMGFLRIWFSLWLWIDQSIQVLLLIIRGLNTNVKLNLNVCRPDNTIFTGLEITRDRIFLAMPRLRAGVAATLATIPRNTPLGSSPPLQVRRKTTLINLYYNYTFALDKNLLSKSQFFLE